MANFQERSSSMSFNGFTGDYLEWNQKRIKGIVDFYGHKFMYYKKILDLGCGYGDISGVLHRLGADVLAVDARADHLKMVNKKFSGIKTQQADLDRNWIFSNRHFDIVLDLGLLCHLADYEKHLRNVCSITTHLVLETAVCDAEDAFKNVPVNESKTVYDLSFNGVGSRPTAAAIERILLECGMNFKRLDQAKFNSAGYVYDWKSRNDGTTDLKKRRIWFAVKKDAPIQIAKTDNVVRPTLASPIISPAPLAATPRELKNQPNSAPSGFVKPTHAKMRLFYNYYQENNPQRKQEIDLCLQKNIDNNNFELIVLESQTKPTYDFFFDKINRLAKPNDISIFCNSDIFFDDTIQLANKLEEKECYALCRYNWNNGQSTLFDNGRPDSQDSWIFRGKIDNVQGNFQLGLLGCDNRIAYEIKQAGYKISNPCKSIKTYHVHNSGIRNYSEANRLHGHYLFLPAISLL